MQTPHPVSLSYLVKRCLKSQNENLTKSTVPVEGA